MRRTIAAAGLLLAVGCSSSPSPSPSPSPSSPSTSDAAPVDAGGATDAGDCNQVPQLGTLISTICATGAPPAATGGAITDGTYVLTDSHQFGDCSSSELAETLIVVAGTVQSLVTTAAGETTRKSIGFEVNATVMVQTQTCPRGAVTTAGYSATPSSITISLVNALATRVSIFTRL